MADFEAQLAALAALWDGQKEHLGDYRGVEALTSIFFLTPQKRGSCGGTELMSKSSQNLAV